jgi:hypothetical protein
VGARNRKGLALALCSAAGQIEIDMKEVTAVDDAGRELLTLMHRARFLDQGSRRKQMSKFFMCALAIDPFKFPDRGLSTYKRLLIAVLAATTMRTGWGQCAGQVSTPATLQDARPGVSLRLRSRA